MNIAQLLEIGFFILFNVHKVKCEVFTSIKDVEALLDTHEHVLNNLRKYILGENRRLEILNRYLKIFSIEQEKANKNTQKYVENPINAFTLIKRLSTDFEHIKTVASEPTKYSWKRQLLYPSEEDLVGAAVAIARLQRTYKLNTTDLAEGKLIATFGHQSEVIPEMHSPMTANDCYYLSYLLFKIKHFYYAAEWFDKALDKLNNDRMIKNPLSELKTFMITHNSKMNPTMFLNMRQSKKQDDKEHDVTLNQYNELCRGEINISPAQASKLHCSYLKSSPFLRLAPIKLEELGTDPEVFLFHDVLPDSEIEIMKQIAEPKLERALVGNLTVKTISEDRIGKSAWLDEYNETLEAVRQRTADFTGMSMAYAESLQVLNYGIGGHYDIHLDVFKSPGDLGNRIATVLFYMSDVSQGGATVFPRLQIAVRPKKGTALYWRNLHPSGKIDRRMLHSACPVLYGYKWVSNIWIREAGQELSNPCPAE